MPRKTALKPQIPAAAAPAETKKPVRAKSSASTHKAPAMKAKAAAASASAPATESHFDLEAHREEIRHQAYLYSIERRGAPGDPLDDWFRAEAEIRRRFKSA